MTVQELNTLHTICELERNQLLTILAMPVQNPQLVLCSTLYIVLCTLYIVVKLIVCFWFFVAIVAGLALFLDKFLISFIPKL